MIKGALKIDPEKVREELLKKYPAKVARKRAKQIIINKVDAGEQVPEVLANARTVPGILTMRGCSYAGCTTGCKRYVACRSARA